MRAYDGSLPSVFAAYNAGPGRIRTWSRLPEYRDEELFTEVAKGEKGATFADIDSGAWDACANPEAGQRVAILLDDEVISSPGVVPELCASGGGPSTQISGNFTQQSAKDLAVLIKGGALPVPVEVIEQRTVGPTLGAAAIEASWKAALIGVALTGLFLLFVYRLVGALTGLGVTMLMTVEVTEHEGLQFTNNRVSFLTDVIIIQRYVEIEGQLRKVLAVVKMRGSSHSGDFRAYEITGNGVLLRDAVDKLLFQRLKLPDYKHWLKTCRSDTVLRPGMETPGAIRAAG